LIKSRLAARGQEVRSRSRQGWQAEKGNETQGGHVQWTERMKAQPDFHALDL
jgi:hypothetical protein